MRGLSSLTAACTALSPSLSRLSGLAPHSNSMPTTFVMIMVVVDMSSEDNQFLATKILRW